jgi:hypothetical protein
MARGFESKSVSDQQESAFDQTGRRGDPGPPPKKRKLELARADLLNRIEAAGDNERYRKMLQSALAAVDKELAGLR